MADYAVGDLQGCADAFERLLSKLCFDPDRDRLFLLGDLVNRGPDSLSTLRRAKALKSRFVLGNHDLHLLAIAFGGHRGKRKDTLDVVLDAPDADELLDWLRGGKLLIDTGSALLCHAGIPHIWRRRDALRYAGEVEDAIRGPGHNAYFEAMYGNLPDRWSQSLQGQDRLRCITNYFTRMRFVAADGTLDFDAKGAPDDAPDGFAPWYTHSRQRALKRVIVFGHWAALMGDCPAADVEALDTGCVWGQRLTAIDLATWRRVSVPA